MNSRASFVKNERRSFTHEAEPKAVPPANGVATAPSNGALKKFDRGTNPRDHRVDSRAGCFLAQRVVEQHDAPASGVVQSDVVPNHSGYSLARRAGAGCASEQNARRTR